MENDLCENYVSDIKYQLDNYEVYEILDLEVDRYQNIVFCPRSIKVNEHEKFPEYLLKKL